MTTRFMVMHKNDRNTEAGLLPPPELMAKMGEFIGEHAQKGQFLGGEGLGASSTRTRLTFRDGRCTVKHGPMAGSNELPAEVLLLTVKSRDEAIRWGERYGKIVGDGELEISPVNEPWDMGFGDKPEDAPLRILMLPKADAVTEAGQGRTPEQKAALTRLKTEMKKAGVLASSEVMKPGSKSRRLVFTDHKVQAIDGPFAESKELIGGFSVLKLPSMEAVMHECMRFAEILGGTLEIDIRPLYEPDELE
jgi:hypothetical protein